jgi:hypothetical protein
MEGGEEDEEEETLTLTSGTVDDEEEEDISTCELLHTGGLCDTCSDDVVTVVDVFAGERQCSVCSMRFHVGSCRC